jgi:large subunit ribosomal protein L30e
MIDLDRSIGLAVKTGKVMFGAENALKNAKTGKVRLIVAASNCSSEFLKDLKYCCQLSEIPLITYEGSSRELGVVCGKPYTVSALCVRDPGDSDILEATRRG